jgi:type VI secretion system protein ImpH
MAAENGRKNPDLSEQLLREPFRFDFFQAVRLLEWVADERARQDPRWPRAPVGRDEAPDREVARFRAQPSLAFPAALVCQLHPPAPCEDGDDGLAPPEMAVTFLGMTGPQGVLPQHYTTLVLHRLRLKDSSLRDFLDLLHHRAVSLFYRAWEKYRLPIAYERARLGRAGGGEDLASWCLYCLAGMGTAGLRGRLDVDDEAFLYYGGHFAHFPRSASALEGVLEDYFALTVRVQQAQGRWLTLDGADRSLLPGPEHPHGLSCELGVSLIVGERVWDVQSKFRLSVGPLDYAQFRGLMPNGDGLRVLGQLTRTYVGPDLDFDVQLVLRGDEVPCCQLAAGRPDGPFLGWNSWLRSVECPRPVGDAIFFVEV